MVADSDPCEQHIGDMFEYCNFELLSKVSTRTLFDFRILQSLMSNYKVQGFPTILVFGAHKECFNCLCIQLLRCMVQFRSESMGIP
jgi:hypothetical protein